MIALQVTIIRLSISISMPVRVRTYYYYLTNELVPKQTHKQLTPTLHCTPVLSTSFFFSAMYLDPTACECRASGLLHLAATTGRNAARSREPTAYRRLVVASTRYPGLDGAARQPAGRWHHRGAAQASCPLAPAVERDAAHAFIHKSCACVRVHVRPASGQRTPRGLVL